MMPLTKVCKQCTESKHIDEFPLFKVIEPNTKQQYSYRRHACKRCISHNKLARRYNITIAQVEAIKAIENCEICDVYIESKSQRYIDHDHTTGEVRGMLCPRCNSVLQLFEEAPQLINKFKLYLIKYTKCQKK